MNPASFNAHGAHPPHEHAHTHPHEHSHDHTAHAQASLGEDAIKLSAHGTCAHDHEETHGCARPDHSHGDHDHSHEPSGFVDSLANHPTVRVLQSLTGLLMIPMLPLMIYAIYTTLHGGFKHEASMPEA